MGFVMGLDQFLEDQVDSVSITVVLSIHATQEKCAGPPVSLRGPRWVPG